MKIMLSTGMVSIPYCSLGSPSMDPEMTIITSVSEKSSESPLQCQR